MAVSLSRFSWWWLTGNENEQVTNGSAVMNSLPDRGFGLKEPENLKFRSARGTRMVSPSTRKVKRKWKSREERRIDKEYDVVLVPSDGFCLSGSESDDSDWSIGWLEPHGPGFQSDGDVDDSFAVLVPCYKHDYEELQEEEEVEPSNEFLSAIRNLPNEYSFEGKNYVEQWLSSLRKF